MGEVFEAMDLPRSTRVTLTILRPAIECDDAALESVLAITRPLTAVGRPELILPLNLERLPPGRVGLITDTRDAQPLSREVVGRALPTLRAVGILRQLVHLLQQIHQAGVHHSALTVGSVLLESHGALADHVLLTDLGLSHLMRFQLEVSQASASLQAISPERALGAEPDAREDQYLVGCLAYTMLTGGPPFRTGNVEEVARRHAIEDPMPIEQRLRGHAPPQPLLDVVHRCLAKDPDDRFADMIGLTAALQSAQDETGITTPWDDLATSRTRSPSGGTRPAAPAEPERIDTAPSIPIELDVPPVSLDPPPPGATRGGLADRWGARTKRAPVPPPPTLDVPPLLPEAFPVHASAPEESTPIDVEPEIRTNPPPLPRTLPRTKASASTRDAPSSGGTASFSGSAAPRTAPGGSGAGSSTSHRAPVQSPLGAGGGPGASTRSAAVPAPPVLQSPSSARFQLPVAPLPAPQPVAARGRSPADTAPGTTATGRAAPHEGAKATRSGVPPLASDSQDRISGRSGPTMGEPGENRTHGVGAGPASALLGSTRGGAGENRAHAPVPPAASAHPSIGAGASSPGGHAGQRPFPGAGATQTAAPHAGTTHPASGTGRLGSQGSHAGAAPSPADVPTADASRPSPTTASRVASTPHAGAAHAPHASRAPELAATRPVPAPGVQPVRPTAPTAPKAPGPISPRPPSAPGRTATSAGAANRSAEVMTFPARAAGVAGELRSRLAPRPPEPPRPAAAESFEPTSLDDEDRAVLSGIAAMLEPEVDAPSADAVPNRIPAVTSAPQESVDVDDFDDDLGLEPKRSRGWMVAAAAIAVLIGGGAALALANREGSDAPIASASIEDSGATQVAPPIEPATPEPPPTPEPEIPTEAPATADPTPPPDPPAAAAPRSPAPASPRAQERRPRAASPSAADEADESDVEEDEEAEDAPAKETRSKKRSSAPAEREPDLSGSASELAERGNALFNAGKFAEASRVLEQAVRRDGRNGNLRILLGDAYFKQGKQSAAREHYLRAQELGHSAAERRLAKVTGD